MRLPCVVLYEPDVKLMVSKIANVSLNASFARATWHDSQVSRLIIKALTLGMLQPSISSTIFVVK